MVASQRKGQTNECTDDKLNEKLTLPDANTYGACDDDKMEEEIEAAASIVDTPFDDVDRCNASLSSASMDIAQKESENESADDMDLDFEDVSDDDFREEQEEEEEKEVEKKQAEHVIEGPADALGVDWASLVNESNAIKSQKTNRMESSVKQLWQPHRILLDVGVSFKMAGTKYANKTLLNAQQNLAHEIQPLSAKAMCVVPIDSKEIRIKMETNTEKFVGIKPELVKLPKTNTQSSDFNNLHPVAAAQVAKRFTSDSPLSNATGPYGRALYANRDIAIRRRLCNLPIAEKNSNTVMSLHTRYEDIAIKLFQKALATSR